MSDTLGFTTGTVTTPALTEFPVGAKLRFNIGYPEEYIKENNPANALAICADTTRIYFGTKCIGGPAVTEFEAAVKAGFTGTFQQWFEKLAEDALADELEAKQDTLVSGTTIKTINSESLLGSGDITIEGTDGYSKTEADAKFAPVSHTHSINDVTGLPSALDAKADTTDLSSYLTTSTAATTYATIANTYTKTQTDNAISTAVSGKADAVHTHNVAEVQGLQEALDEKADTSTTYTKAETDTAITNAVKGKADTSALSAYLTTASASSTYATKSALETTDGQVSQLALQVNGKQNALTYYTENTTDKYAHITTSGCILNVGADSIGCEVSGGSSLTIDERYVKLVGEGTLNDKAIATTDAIPTKTSDLTNDSGYIKNTAYTKVELKSETTSASISISDQETNTNIIVDSGIETLKVEAVDTLQVEVAVFIPKTCTTSIPDIPIIGEIPTDGSADYTIVFFNGTAVVGTFS